MAKITQAQWKRYIQRLRQINDRAADEIRNVVTSNGGYENIDRQKLIDFAYGVSTKYGEASAALSAQMYDAIAELSAAGVPAALPAETASYQEVAKTVNGIIKKTGSEEVLAQGVGRLVKMAGTDTMLSNAYRDRPKGSGSKRKHSGAQVAWIPWGDTCPFCLTLASKGWVNQTEWAENSHSEHIHANCDCTYAVRFSKDFDVEGYDPDQYKKMYDEAEGETRDEKLNSMRRMQYQDPETRDRINAQKRAAYEKKKLMIAAQTDGEASIPKSMIGIFDDYEPLDLSEKEKKSLRGLHEKSVENRYEYGKILYTEGETEDLTSEKYDRVALPVKQTEGTGLRVLHTHTNDTPPSSADFKPLTLEKVDRIDIMANNGDVWVIEVGDGYRPTEKELTEKLAEIKRGVIKDLSDFPGYDEWTPDERSYMVIREKMYRVSREYGWKAMGGRLDE